MSRVIHPGLALRAIEIAGMPWRWAEQHDVTQRCPVSLRAKVAWSWDGKELIVTPLRDAHELLHELAHWMVAPVSRRKLVEHGLGRAPWSDVAFNHSSHIAYPKKTRIGLQTRDRDESLTCLLEVYFVRLLGGSWRSVADELSLGGYQGINNPVKWERFIQDESEDWSYQQPGFLTNADAVKVLRKRGLWKRAEKIAARATERGSVTWMPKELLG